jgi:hypothetical protein
MLLKNKNIDKIIRFDKQVRISKQEWIQTFIDPIFFDFHKKRFRWIYMK